MKPERLRSTLYVPPCKSLFPFIQLFHWQIILQREKNQAFIVLSWFQLCVSGN